MTAGDAALIFSKKIGGVYEWNVLLVSEAVAVILYVPTGQRFEITVRADD